MENISRIINLEGAFNVREIGGLPLKNGRKIKHKKIIRSGKLSNLTEKDCDYLVKEWNLSRIIDLRNDNEVREFADLEIPNVNYQRIDMIPREQKGISREEFGLSKLEITIRRAKSFAEGEGAEKLLKSIYSQMAEDEVCIKKIRDFFDIILEHNDGSFIWHCTSGKDRTGITAALLLYALGADLETIKSDYLFTNEQTKNRLENLLKMMREHSAAEELVYEIEVLESVKWEYLEGFFENIQKLYGSIEDFLRNKIQLSEEKINILLEKYTEIL